MKSAVFTTDVNDAMLNDVQYINSTIQTLSKDFQMSEKLWSYYWIELDYHIQY